MNDLQSPAADDHSALEAVPLTIAAAISAVATWTHRTERRRRDICSSLRIAAKIIGKPPEAITLDPRTLSATLTGRPPRTYGLEPKRYQNVMADLRCVVRMLVASPEASPTAVADPAWSALLDDAPGDWARLRLNRFVRFCVSNKISPCEVTDVDFDKFVEFNSKNKIVSRSGNGIARIVKIWNKMVDDQPYLRLKRVERRNSTNQYVLPVESFPPNFAADLENWCRARGRGDLGDIFDGLSDENPSAQSAAAPLPSRPMRASTIALRRAQILAAATALVHSGIDPSKIQTLRDLVVPFGSVRSIARFHYDRRAGVATVGVFGVLEALRQVAKYHVRLQADDVMQISRLRDRVRPRKEGIVARNRERLRPLQDERHRAALLHLPAELLRQAETARLPSRRARLGACAVALEILLFCPLRIANLAHLRLDLHLRRVLGGDRRLTHIVIAAEETKNAASIDWPIPPSSLPVLNAWISRFRGDSECAVDTPWLFPGKFGGCRAVSSLRLVLEQEIARCTGLEIHPHLLRHFAAMLFLSHNPGHYETVRRILGHKSLKTTIDSYMPAEADAAARRFDDVVMQERAATRLVAQRTYRGRRRRMGAATKPKKATSGARRPLNGDGRDA